jgi:acyl carrier protein
MAAGDGSEVAIRPGPDRVRPGPDRGWATKLVSDALTAAIPGLRVETLDEGQELYADLGLDSLGFAMLLIELEGKLSVQLVDEDLMNIDLVHVSDLIDLVERISLSAAT